MTLTELDRRAVARAFDRAASTYDEHAALQHEVEDRLLERVDYFELDPERVLDLGCGTGRGSQALAKRFPRADIVSLDRSPAMLTHARDRAREGEAVREAALVNADMHALPFAERRFDLVFSSLAVQWSAEEPRLFAGVRRILRPGGLFLFTSFGPDTLTELRTAWAEVDPRPRVNRFVDLHDVGDALVAAGFQEPVMDVERLTVTYRRVMDLMRDLKAIGATNAASERAAGLTGKRMLSDVIAAYEQFRVDDRYPASYEVVFGAAFGAPEGRPVRGPEGEVATVSIESLRRERGR
jgi:malonyl-CoA O-methyltransferase